MSSLPSSAAPPPLSIHARIRLADHLDVPNIRRLIQKMAEYERLTHLLSATESSLSSTLFPSPPLPPFLSPTVLILELSPSPFPHPQSNLSSRTIPLRSHAPDPESPAFASPRGDGVVVAGFLLCFPNYSTFLGRPGIYVEDVFVREAWRRMGMGRMMMEAVAREAARRGCGRVEWCVLDWNENAIGFYRGMGAELLKEWRICRLGGVELAKFAGDEEDQE